VKRKWGLLVLILVGIVLIPIVACAVVASWVAPRVLGAGPDGIDLRPTPGPIQPEAALPGEVAGYQQGDWHRVTIFHGLELGPDAVEAHYGGPDGSVRVVAARMTSYHHAASAVSDLAQQLEEAGVLDSRRLLAEEPYLGWKSASGKRNFAYWYAPGWEVDQRGFIWQSGNWCFIVASNSPVARRDVVLAFPY
jgi:hypothetical protein